MILHWGSNYSTRHRRIIHIGTRGFGGARYPVLDSKMTSYENMDKTTKDGGNQVEYVDEDPAILALYEKELRSRNLNSKMGEFVGPRK